VTHVQLFSLPWDSWSVGVKDNLHRQLGPTHHSEFYWNLLRLQMGGQTVVLNFLHLCVCVCVYGVFCVCICAVYVCYMLCVSTYGLCMCGMCCECLWCGCVLCVLCVWYVLCVCVLCVCMVCSVCVYVLCVYVVCYVYLFFFLFKDLSIHYTQAHCSRPQTHQKRASDLSTDGCEPPCGCWELNS